jgi:predicted Zn-dependent protease
MQYSNPQIPEGINTGEEHPLKEFVLLGAGVIAIVASAALLLGYLADAFSNRIPFGVELSITGNRFKLESTAPRMETYLNALAVKLAAAQNLPGDMSIAVHYVDDDTVNAFATLGGNIVMFRGLLEKLPNENALAMVLAHEIAHIKHRDPIRGAGRGVVIGLALSMVSSTLGNAVTDQVLAGGGMLTVLQFSREQESAADETALETLRVHYGHVVGAADLFEVLDKSGPGFSPPEFFNSHPLTQNRVERIRELAAKSGNATTPEPQPLPRDYAAWMSRTAGVETER